MGQRDKESRGQGEVATRRVGDKESSGQGEQEKGEKEMDGKDDRALQD